MLVVVNGEKKDYEKSDILITELLEINEVKHPKMVSVQLNGEFVEREDFETTKVIENDSVDFLYFMGGGQ